MSDSRVESTRTANIRSLARMIDWMQNNIFVTVILFPAIVTIVVTYALYRFGVIQRASTNYAAAREARDRRRIEKELRSAYRSDAEVHRIIAAVEDPAAFNAHVIVQSHRSTTGVVLATTTLIFGVLIALLYSTLSAFDDANVRELSTFDTVFATTIQIVLMVLSVLTYTLSLLGRRRIRREVTLASTLREAVKEGLDLDHATTAEIREALELPDSAEASTESESGLHPEGTG